MAAISRWRQCMSSLAVIPVAGVSCVFMLLAWLDKAVAWWSSEVGEHKVLPYLQVEDTALYMAPSPHNLALLSLSSQSMFGYQPTPWLPAAAHTLVGNLWRQHTVTPVVNSERVRLPDGGEVAVDWFADPDAHAGKPVLLLVPGTKGTKDSSYIQCAARMGIENGFVPVVTALRGCGVQTLSTPRCFDGASYSDLASVMNHIHEVCGRGVRVAALGYSMGGGMLAHYVSHSQANGLESGIDAAVAVSATADYAQAVEHMHTSWESRAYNFMLTNIVKLSLWQHRELLRSVKQLNFSRAWLSTSVREWHAAVTCPLQQSSSSAKFCESVSYAPLLATISKPLLFISSEDDPICPHTSLPTHFTATNSQLWVLKTRYGGHTAFCSGWVPWRSIPWDTSTAVTWLTHALTLPK